MTDAHEVLRCTTDCNTLLTVGRSYLLTESYKAKGLLAVSTLAFGTIAVVQVDQLGCSALQLKIPAIQTQNCLTGMVSLSNSG